MGSLLQRHFSWTTVILYQAGEQLHPNQASLVNDVGIDETLTGSQHIHLVKKQVAKAMMDECPIVEIKAPDGNYNYQAKYTKGLTEYFVPAPLPDAITEEAQQISKKVFQVLGCRGLSRVDFRLDSGNHLYVLELNTIPGFTETSLFPKAAREAGIEFPALCDRIMRMATISSC